ncbi:ABC transporter substrate-binding protein [Nakamurella leprariae]|uniref:Amino acid ABC transporter substrate-binding protein n=1 Tax=Nakamurella leprariae TaxID=2803911 RepID=A0A939C2I4_9ACTN|nr:ABC transporter substrate-binding protein [Nakamurella leprariae]MBM9468294.1 amino acid ABC transporter substrate-binding protein [Nakamurella leprariae]
MTIRSTVRRPARTLLVPAAAAVLLLSACGGSDDAGSSASSTPASSSSAASSTSSSSAGSSTAGSSASGSDAATGVTQADIDAAKETLIADGVLTTCTHLPYAPFQSPDDDGNIVGFDVDMLDLVAEQLGVEQTIVDTPFEGIKSGQDLSTGKCDIAAAAMSITPEREQVILFSEGYFDANQALLVRTGDSYTTLADLSGKRLGAQAATTGLEYAQENADASGYEIVEFEDLAAEQQALVTGQVDAAINDLPVWSEFVKEQPGRAEITGQFDTGDRYGFGMKLGNDALKRVVDGTLEAAREDGRYDDIYAQWIGTTPGS